jgi:acyl carrier protein
MKKKILDFVCKMTFTDQNNINNETLLFEEGIFDSMSMINLISYLEEDFSIKVYDSELDAENFESIDAIASFLEGKLKASE